ncbi:extracellular solute-binding protein [Paenibacillus silvisoli]|uniref:extracellular solute-binding protein n=1 Tax=Paenibacillus silvisoli TaxID=3110539 RepID=UPI002804E357|nr:extracellular solute-binding protein [Paenibacillus silvisoli]
MEKTKRKARRLGMLTVAVLLVAAVFSGCSSNNNGKEENGNAAAQTETDTQADSSNTTDTTNTSTNKAETETPADPLAEHMDISIAMWGIGDALPDGVEDPVLDAISKKLNITIKPVNVTWDDYAQKIQVWAASDQLPDLFAIDAVTSPNLTSWATQGIIHQLPDDLSAYPTLAKMMEGPDFQAYKFPLGDPNGKFFSIPRPNFRDANLNANSHGIIIRKDWMQNVGIAKAPETFDEFIALMKAFAEKDPDQNGKKDTVGLTAYSPAWLPYLMQAYEPGLMGGVSTWIRNNGQWIPSFTTDRATEGVKAIKKLYDEGGLDKDIATIKGSEGIDKFASGIAGAYAHDTVPGTLLQIKTKYEQLNPGKKFEDAFMIMPPLKNVDGNYYRFYDTGIWSESYINAKADDAKVDRILRLFDFLLSEEGFNLTHFGIEGVDYVKQGDKIVMVDQKDDTGNALVLSSKYPFMKINYFAEWSGTSSATNPTLPLTLRNMSKENLDNLLANAKTADTDLRLNFIDYPSRAKANEKFDVDLIKVILSKDAEKTWKDMTQAYLADNYDTIIKEFNAKTKELGINP